MPADVLLIDPSQEPLPEEIRGYFHETYDALTGLGFEHVAVMALPSLLPNVRTILALYRNDSTLDLAMSSFILTIGGAKSVRARYVEFYRRYSDNVVVQTNNSPELGSFPAREGAHTTQFWEIQDVARLYHLHQFLAEKFRRSGHAVNRLDAQYQGDPVRYVAEDVLDRSFGDQIETGYLARCAEGYRPTAKGALIMTWQELWPIKPMRRAKRRRQAAEVLREFGIAGRDL